MVDEAGTGSTGRQGYGYGGGHCNEHTCQSFCIGKGDSCDGGPSECCPGLSCNVVGVNYASCQ